MMSKETYKIAIVDDETEASDKLASYLERFAIEKGCVFDCVFFSDGINFIDKYSADYDIVFMDIDMKIYNGMRTAERLREKDSEVLLVFVTNLAQFAAAGYKVNAADYLVKPYDYSELAFTLSQLLSGLEGRKKREIVIKNGSGNKRIAASNISYIEVYGHKVVYHTDIGDIESWASLSAVIEGLPYGFAKCNVSTLVNLARVSAIRGDSVIVGDTELSVSRRCKKEFKNMLFEYVGRM